MRAAVSVFAVGTMFVGLPERAAARQGPSERFCSPILRHLSGRADCGKSRLPIDMWFGAEPVQGLSLLPVVNRTFVRGSYAIERNSGAA